MAYSREQIQHLFQSQFSQATWTDFIINFFKAQSLRRVPEPLDIDQSEGQGYYWGKLSTTDDYEISFFYLKMNRSIDQRRVGLRQLVNRYIKIDSDAGIAVFDDGSHWRLSFITDMRGEKTSPKRYTFVFGDAEKRYHTAVDRFMELQRTGISYKNIREAFSVETLTKQFYNDLFDWYTWALDPSTGVYFPNNPNTNADDTHQLDTKLIRLITRLMFVWFIKQKQLVPANLFDPEELKLYLRDFDPMSMDSANYYQGILQNLFFATLNRPIKNVTYDKDGREIIERRGFAHLKDKPDVKSLYRYQELFKISEEQITHLFEFIPFINGGLFECLDKNKTSDGVDQAYYDDGFSRNSTIRDGHWTRRAFVPNKLFFDPEDGIISIFNRYNFTVEENSPSEQQVALDPELLGKVFENLLGAYNPETEQTARNQSGSFYTPREIVNYMVDISLQQFLGDTDEVKALFSDDFEYDENKQAFYNDVVERLKAIKVLDPACGSGAFPIGMLNRIVQLLQNLKAQGSKYDLKLQIMENCIYGGDIQTIAAQITKLRFFISLVCDCEKSDNPDENYGIPNLPNLETHFVSCDSLIALKKPQQYNLFEQDVIALKKKLQEVRHEHFMAKTVYQKTKLRNRDKELRNELAQMLTDDNVIASADAKQLVAWNPYDQNGRASFFDPEWMFGIKDGFDVVIGNPPYIQLQADKGRLGDLYKPCDYETFNKTGDMYCLFYERGNQLLGKNGALCYITSNKWMRQKYGENLRVYLTKKTDPKILIDFCETHVFESACVMTNILLFLRQQNSRSLSATQINDDYIETSNIQLYVVEHQVNCNFAGTESWVVRSDMARAIKRKVEAQGKPLEKWSLDINYGIKTGYDKAFFIDGATRQYILDNCRTDKERKLTNEIIRPMLRGKDIRKYGKSWNNLYLIGTFPAKHLDISLLPSIEQHLLSFGKQRLEQAGKKFLVDGEIISSRKKSCNAWYETQDTIKYWAAFDEPKIIYPETSKFLPFYLDEDGFLTTKTCFIMVGKHISYLTALFNSSLFKYCFRDDFGTLFGGARTLSKIFFDKIPIKEVTDEVDAEFRTLVLDIQVDYSDEKAKAIDQKIFDLYGLTPEERETIGYITIE